MKPQLIVFEGPDAVGKSTLATHLKALIDRSNVPAEAFAFPGKGPCTLGKLVYDLHHSPEEFGISRITPAALQALHLAAHLDAIADLILPAMASGKWVVLDRFWWSTWVYGIAAGIDRRILKSLIQAEQFAWATITPSVIFLVERSVPLDQHSPTNFPMLTKLYQDLGSEQADQSQIVHLVNEDWESAKQGVEQWLYARTHP